MGKIEWDIINEDEKSLHVLLKGVDLQVANAIRRTILNDVPTLAIEDVAIYENSSVFFDEYIAHRIGLIPLRTDKTIREGEKITFILDKSGPGTVYSGDLRCEDPKIEIVDKKIPIIKLNEGEVLRIEAKAELNSGKEHAKWQPGLAVSTAYPELTFNKEALDKNVDCKNICPTGALEVKPDSITLKDPLKCSLCGYCEEKCGDGAIVITPAKDKAILYIESYGQKKPRTIFKDAIDILQKKMKEIKDNI